MRANHRHAAASVMLTVPLLFAQSLDAQTSSLTLSGDPQPLVISTAVAGFGPDPAWDEGTTYSLTAAQTSSIEAQLDSPLPAGVTLRVQLEPPAGALGAGAVVLSTTAQVLVSSIPAGTYSGLGIRYELRATVEAGVVPLGTRRVTFTLVETP